MKTIVYTKYGIIKGNEREDGLEFLGIPYAAPPVGKLRFLPPISPEAWKGTLDCTKFGPAAPQLHVTELKMLEKGEEISEDCLKLNVYTPDTAGEKRPVLVYVHAGAFQKGSGHVGFNSRTYLEQNIVTVTVNYRLGALGFLDFTEYLGEKYSQSGNTGLLDIIQSLKWVKDNIGYFGGDSGNVTLFGQSAGAKIITSLMLMEKAKGLFHKAFVTSGGVHCIRDRKTAEKITGLFMREAGLNKENADRLLRMPWEEIVKAQTELFKGLNLHTCGPVFDGINFCENNALDIIRHGKASMVPVVYGTNRDELQLYYYAYNFRKLDSYMANRLFGDNADIVLKEYRVRVKEYYTMENFVEFMTEYIYRQPCLKFCLEMAKAGNDSVYMFRNDYDKLPIRAGHCSEAQFTMREYEKYGVKEHPVFYYRLADSVVEAAAAFMRTGKPYSSNIPEWPPFTAGEQKIMVWNEEGCYVAKAGKSYVTPDMPEQIYMLE